MNRTDGLLIFWIIAGRDQTLSRMLKSSIQKMLIRIASLNFDTDCKFASSSRIFKRYMSFQTIHYTSLLKIIKVKALEHLKQ